ncbi:hypothetical protein FM21_18830 [Streptomyces mutabilis]|uniref:Uncharacterized protein n=1 Tax=Streptomyces mutabilis TaxID=67332 RepID=A0A086MVJ9_9ACTN|nr:hypothetical protein FM21_18830 [Streptomyces mutabilis]
MAARGLKLAAARRKTRLPWWSPRQARTRAKSVVMPCSRTYERPAKSRVSLGGEAMATVPSGA